jgi:NADH-quinone oxidoreductase subunit N
LFGYAPGLTIAMTIFLVSLGGIPPLGGWVAKFYVFKALIAADNGWAVALAVIGVVNSVVALFYYLNVARHMWFMPTPDGDTSPISVPPPLVSALAICAVATVAIGVVPGIVLRFGDLATFATAAR